MRPEMTGGVPELARTFSQRLRAVLKEKPLNGTAAAATIGVHRRTLSRRLKSEGMSFKRIANEARSGVAKQLLADTNMSLAEISAALKFSEPAAFTHAFRRWTGTTPSAWRKKLRHVEWPCSVERPDSARLPWRKRWRNRASASRDATQRTL
jgi:AraC-like DNA-binding protein